jgi:DNA-binding MarR family transcriptional regulator
MDGMQGAKEVDMPRTRRVANPYSSSPPTSTDESFDLSNNVNYLLRRAHQRAEDLFAEAMNGLDVTPRQATLLYNIGQNAGTSLTELTRISGIDRGTISEMVPRMERRGLLVQAKADVDGRAKALWLTPSGEELVREVVARTEGGLADRVLSTLPHEYRELFIKMLMQLVGLEVESRTRTD